MPWVTIFVVVFGLMIVSLVMTARRAGPQTVAETDLKRAVTLRRATADDPGEGWGKLGSKTAADGLNLKFDHDDDPQAEASFFVEGGDRKVVNAAANRIAVRLGSEFETHHVHTQGHVFQVRLRGTGSVVGKQVRVQMHVHRDGTPWCGRVENDDDTEAAVGGWIEFEWVEVLRVGRAT